ncbi:Holliday junction branch migration protein RuvA [Leptospira sp. GIMC2001]|uniref:Holliday junction branch migration protein RuvA n=1 Tax=Leptospira sp. GIMC2001 TaxID=1513297 RepID=UPI00234A25C9|nr:Holliday junction branch migration protein RuvA [Leptospira sp. GIMC2001]WCL51181.1 Holliday junction branch migration protein RuvA [Leptospira sp. GIMC2001]
MIASLRGNVLRLEMGHVILETASGVGYEIQIPFPTHLHLKSLPENANIVLHIYHSITDRSQKLFGFLTARDRELFRLMKSFNGIGEQTSLKILSFYDADALFNIAKAENKQALEKIPKVKGKTSEKVLFELKQNLKKLESFLSDHFVEDETISTQESLDSQLELAILGLVQLGFDEKTSKKEAESRWKAGLKEASLIIGDVLKNL